MLGWMINLYDQTTKDPWDVGSLERSNRVACWQTGLGGIQWLDAMVGRSEALLFSCAGYPEIYIASALSIKSALRFGVPLHDSPPVIGTDPGSEYYLPAGWVGEVSLDVRRLDATRDARLITVEAWDLS